MKKIQHPTFGPCFELIAPADIAFSSRAQGALVNKTILPSGAETPSLDLWIRDAFLVPREHAPEGAHMPKNAAPQRQPTSGQKTMVVLVVLALCGLAIYLGIHHPEMML